MAKIYYDKDVKKDFLENKTVAVIGYGSQGRGQSLNLKDSGVKVIVGLRKDGPSWEKAQKDGLNVETIENAVKQADLVQILVPDEVQPQVFCTNNIMEKMLMLLW